MSVSTSRRPLTKSVLESNNYVSFWTDWIRLFPICCEVVITPKEFQCGRIGTRGGRRWIRRYLGGSCDDSTHGTSSPRGEFCHLAISSPSEIVLLNTVWISGQLNNQGRPRDSVPFSMTEHRSSILRLFESFRDDVDEYHDRRERLIKVCFYSKIILLFLLMLLRLVETSLIFPRRLFFSFIAVRWKNQDQMRANILGTNLPQEKVMTSYVKRKISMLICRLNLRETSFGATSDKYPLDCRNT